ncbi:hypothetical protein ACOSQ2_010163 [Xanthoceras sorbifolium]
MIQSGNDLLWKNTLLWLVKRSHLKSNSKFLNSITLQKWYSKVTIIVSKAFIFEGEALIDSGADLNCISEGIIPSQYFSKTTQMLNRANGGRMLIEYKLSGAAKQLEESVCSDVPNAFWSRHKHMVCLPYVNGFDERRVSTKSKTYPDEQQTY